jgi:hypothetical protein
VHRTTVLAYPALPMERPNGPLDEARTLCRAIATVAVEACSTRDSRVLVTALRLIVPRARRAAELLLTLEDAA